ncbi:50S ribosomal protein L6 [Leuconostoc mesenteroides]|jgi:large subunit ribosomal protein L6|uniref:Large ribosomal subunit protein uL6 n=1 Tax=Leuconostoc mesenteroides TaxID=1245 RepID=A0A843Z2F6_LEUME|nr:50S ribosomal protein L6 [Leuconostoc mesenteroides]ARN62683.1 50S ribosomal protein L6 [Leuconostoc mesenteroides subsp. mesenteroides]MBZ1513496.1 50S ribosomal protein L6 [Leuconostoc mesenteroides]MBZ1517675.1 50S ribosomal protein L6 [Leuconostoc mesenteroides]MBZ1520415.1 50S ribosomal protein L6 [Leuconostoc mesenteroides]MBZ1522227.1 50S ribosomal protein L6 [Leuconostoc mesenteroides]
MSRIGNKTITLPADVTVSQEGAVVTIKGPKGELSREIVSAITMTVEGNEVSFSRDSDDSKTRALHGTTRANVANMVEGVSEGFTKTLKLVGVGYRAAKSGSKLTLSVGYSHPVDFEDREELSVEVPDALTIKVSGISKQKVGDLAAEIRAVRSPEPYKGKGIRYEGEVVRRKEGKTGK